MGTVWLARAEGRRLIANPVAVSLFVAAVRWPGFFKKDFQMDAACKWHHRRLQWRSLFSRPIKKHFEAFVVAAESRSTGSELVTEARNQTAHLLWIRNAAWAIVVILPALAALIVLTSRRQPSMVDLMATVDYETRQLDRLIEAARSSDRLQEQEAVSEFAHKFYGERASLPAENLDGLDQYVKNISGISQEDGAKAKAWIDAKKIELAKSQQDLNTVLKKEIAEQRGRVDRATRALDGARDRQTD